jgi:hypothetical protein
MLRVPMLARFLDTPALLVAVALRVQEETDDSQSLEWLERAARLPHRQLTSELGLPLPRVLRKCTADALRPACIESLRQLRDDRDALRLIRHADRISATLILGLNSPLIRHHASLEFFAQVGRSRKRHRPSPTKLGDLVMFLAEYLPGARIQSIDQYLKLREKYRALIRQDRIGRRQRPRFPPPPWPGEAGYAAPLDDWRALIRESLEMGNCTGKEPSFLESVTQGRMYFYRIEQAWGMDRATLCVERDGRHWRIAQARGRWNATLRRSQLLCLAVWVADQQGLSNEHLCL